MQDWTAIDAHISACLRLNFSTSRCQSLSGGCINSAWQIQDHYNVFFVKLNSTHFTEMFAAEFEGLRALESSQSIKIPTPIVYGNTDQNAYLVTEYLSLNHTYSATTLGEQLASMHRSTQKKYGWHQDNTIGSTPQPNQQTDDWVSFWRENRLNFQLNLAQNNGHNGQLQSLGRQLSDKLPLLFSSYTPEASLLHGDLWSGNVAGCDGQPVIFDPAVYYGDRESDLAMSELFGGFPDSFYAAYRASWPLDSGYEVRKNLYKLYHLLNHLNLFGGGYYQQSLRCLQLLLSEM